MISRRRFSKTLLALTAATTAGLGRGAAPGRRAVPGRGAAGPELPFRVPAVYEKDWVFQSDTHNVWGTNIIKGRDGRFHAIFSRWPKFRGHLAWVTHSEIAHAVADRLTGPYRFRKLVLPPRGRTYWDGDCTHNPHLLEYDGKYYLYYMGNRGSGYWDRTEPDRRPTMADREWWVNRNNQRIGVAIAEDLDGPWQRFDRPLIDVSAGRRMVSTPTVSIRPDGKFLMAYKYVEDMGGERGGRVFHVTALAAAPTGPFVDTGVPFIVHPTARFACDDHVEWYQNSRYYCIAKDQQGAWSRESRAPAGSMLLFVSDEEGLVWTLARNALVIRAGEIRWSDGSRIPCRRTADMPKLYIEDGEVKALITAVLPEDTDDSFAVIAPVLPLSE